MAAARCKRPSARWLLAALAFGGAGCGTESPRPESDAGPSATIDASEVDASLPDGAVNRPPDVSMKDAASSGDGQGRDSASCPCVDFAPTNPGGCTMFGDPGTWCCPTIDCQ